MNQLHKMDHNSLTRLAQKLHWDRVQMGRGGGEGREASKLTLKVL